MSKVTSIAVMKKETEFNSQEISVIEQVVMQGDLSKLSPQQRVTYYRKVCESSGLNPFTRPFDYIMLNGKLTLYAKKDATEQLRKLNSVSIISLDAQLMDDLYIVKATARTPDGRTDTATGAVCLSSLRGDAKANAIMKAETKAKRRVTLSISGMGWTDETEIESIPNSKLVSIDMDTGVIEGQPIEKDKITLEQAGEIKALMSQCDKEFKKNMHLKLTLGLKVNNFADIPSHEFEDIKNSALENIEKNKIKKIEPRDVVDCESSKSIFAEV